MELKNRVGHWPGMMLNFRRGYNYTYERLNYGSGGGGPGKLLPR